MDEKNGRTTVLFVCMGNSCRSLMAEAIARRDASDAIQPFSAGLSPIGYVAEPTRQTLLKNGYGEEGLWSKGISPAIWKQADIVINMSGRARELAFREYSKVRDCEIQDPFHENPVIFQQVFEKIQLLVAELAQECRAKKPAVRTTERRTHARLSLASPLSIGLNGKDNAAVLNISEDGLALSADVSLPNRPLHNLRIQFLETKCFLDAPCQIAWRSEDNKKVGIQFVGLTEEDRRQVREWVSARASFDDFQGKIEKTCEERPARPKTPVLPLLENIIHEPSASSGALEKREEPSAPAFPSLPPALPGADKPVPRPTSYVATKRPPGKSHPRFRPRTAPVHLNSRAARQVWRAFVAVLIGLAIVGLTWLATQRLVWTKEIPVTQKTPVLTSPVQRTASSPTNMVLSKVSPTTPQSQARAATVLSVRPSSKASSQPAGHSSAQSKAKKQFSRIAASANNRPLQRLPQGQHSDAPPTPPQLDAKLAQPADLVALSPNVMAPAKPKGKAHIAHSAINFATVEVFTNPYPSLRIPEGRALNKQRSAATLELGHILSRVEPIYPEEAKQQGIQGTVKLHAFIDRYGAVEKLQSADHSPILVAAAMNAVRQWRYSETLLAGKPVETEQDIAIAFRLPNPSAPRN